MFRSKRITRLGDTPCIFVHAGAGYHSVANEKIHLQACVDAAKAGMLLLRNGGCAVDAVEIAGKVLEDREITNAGYGSNLAIDGTVECDAIVVDHHGRSGGCGAVSQIRNPISLARLILDHSSRALSLKRVPPNLLIGQGATDFAYEQNMPVLPHDALVSPAAKDRWLRWRSDMHNVESRSTTSHSRSSYYDISSNAAPEPSSLRKRTRDEDIRRAHTRAMKSGVWNDAQPLSPPASDSPSAMSARNTSDSSSRSTSSPVDMNDYELDFDGDGDGSRIDPRGPPRPYYTNGTNMIDPHLLQQMPGMNDGHPALRNAPETEVEMSDLDDFEERPSRYRHHDQSEWHNGPSSSEDSSSTTTSLQLPSLTPSPPEGLSPAATPSVDLQSSLIESVERNKLESSTSTGTSSIDHVLDNSHLPGTARPRTEKQEDLITDTVGIIAVDAFENIACGASSGGIGMKHRGRVGPAALNGVGAAIIPVDVEDKTRTSIAVVTSGTGEHMGTTMAGHLFAERLYTGLKKVRGGGFAEADNDEELIRDTIENEFMGHASVKANSQSAAAIGLLAVKKTKEGTYLYFAHNTDSFAIASQRADEAQPMCTMSRGPGNGAIAQGGRAISPRKSRR